MPLRDRVLHLLRLTEKPAPPPESGADLETFRASPRFLKYKIALWLPGQIFTLIGLLFSLFIFSRMEGFFDNEQLAEVQQRLLERGVIPWDLDYFSIFSFFETLALITFVFQFVISAFTLKLAWELRWYMVGDEFLRIRHGLWRVNEQTMTVARIQNMEVRRGPVQRLFGIADLEVRTAGGGSAIKNAEEAAASGKDDLHVARFRGLENADALRDRLREQLARHRGAGLGDMDDHVHGVGHPDDEAELAAAAQEFRDETRALRLVLEGRS